MDVDPVKDAAAPEKPSRNVAVAEGSNKWPAEPPGLQTGAEQSGQAPASSGLQQDPAASVWQKPRTDKV